VKAPPSTMQKANEEGGRRSFGAESEPLPAPRLRQALDDLFTPSPIRNWLDFLTSALCFYGGFAIVATVPLDIPLTVTSLRELWRVAGADSRGATALAGERRAGLPE
jgi:hypothetical protein